MKNVKVEVKEGRKAGSRQYHSFLLTYEHRFHAGQYIKIASEYTKFFSFEQ
jgi:hypothetical protein